VSENQSHGPWDVSPRSTSRTTPSGSTWVALQVAAIPGVDVQVQVDESTGATWHSAHPRHRPDSGVQVQAVRGPAGPAASGTTARPQIKPPRSTPAGGLVEEANGPFGIELRAQVPTVSSGLQPARFVGIDGSALVPACRVPRRRHPGPARPPTQLEATPFASSSSSAVARRCPSAQSAGPASARGSAQPTAEAAGRAVALRPRTCAHLRRVSLTTRALRTDPHDGRPGPTLASFRRTRAQTEADELQRRERDASTVRR
jgi:hypothetical protein